ncbi:ABC transporter, permease protein [Marvinbryantia formatexigens DSM 14469]|uniref:ABC transporter, permease protein n=1 Tax=Marvinbryantia formatexigens DSM 14469 TaxID=478749 RepID=C6LAI0_9FIRM|nr:iron ABC transporter permease [Marvinbryantia formatexigens]EET62587.1 ABC transporter, permease protein [Marvinbryantia formatexigens DSM 14469]UWO23257.1 iron ABC transporter permease [Marvinbryantia formatexigens DSM 14469]SDG61292.1 iron(III) transport system permease protein [Marvinbryantia formatexigens]
MGKIKAKFRDGTINIPGLLLKLLLIWFILSFLVFPNVNLILKVFIKDGQFSLEAIPKIMKSARAIKSLKNSFLLAFDSIVTVNISGILIVLFTEYFDIKGSKLLSMGFMTTLIYGGVVLVTGYKFVYGETGIVTKVLLQFFPDMDPQWFVGFWAVLFIMTFSGTSNHMMFLTNAIRNLDYHTIEAAKNMGASQMSILFKIVLPTLKPTIFAITILTFIAALSTMSGPLIVGGPDFQTINPMIKTFADMNGSRDIAALLAIILGLATSILLFIMQKIEKKGNYISVSKTKARMVKQKIENPVLNVIAHIVAYVMFVIYMLPIINVVVFSFTDGLTIKTGQLRADSFTLENYAKLFRSSTAYKPYLVSIVYSLAAALIVAVICIAVARIVTKAKHKWDKLYEPLILIPWLLPSTMIALGLMMTYDEPRINVMNKVLVATTVIMLIAYIIIKIPFSYRMIRAAFVGLDGNMEEAAQVMGAKPFYTMRKVILPVIMPVVLSVIVLNFNSLLSEYDLSVFLYHPLFKPLGIVIKSATDETATTDAQAMAFVYTVILMIISTIALWLGRYDGISTIKKFFAKKKKR